MNFGKRPPDPPRHDPLAGSRQEVVPIPVSEWHDEIIQRLDALEEGVAVLLEVAAAEAKAGGTLSPGVLSRLESAREALLAKDDPE